MLAGDKQQKGGRRFVALLFCLGLLQIAGYYFAGAMVNGVGPLAIPQPDTPLYMQAARRIVEGGAFSYSAGESACTGTTSVLYPFLLAIPYALGIRGDALCGAGFALNSICYLLFLLGWGLVIMSLFPDARRRLFAGVGLALFGQTAFAALSQSDIGFWLAASACFVAALAAARFWLVGIFLVLLPWVRPEGMICNLAFLGMAILAFCPALRSGVESRRKRLLLGLLGLVSLVSVFVFNYYLVGEAQFSSVAGKGHLTLFGLVEGFHRTASDLMTIARTLLFGYPLSAPRAFYFVPFLGAVLFWTGVFVHDWRRSSVWKDLVVLMAAFGGVLSVAQSGWQNTNMDRYLAWVMPVLVIAMAEGAAALQDWLKDRVPCASMVWVIPLGFLGCAMVEFWCCFHATSQESEALTAFARQVELLLPPKASVGTIGNCGLAYNFSDRRLAHLAGIYSPEFRSKNVYANLERLKWDPSLRFDYWIHDAEDDYCRGFFEAQGEAMVLGGPNGLSVYRADWAPFDNAAVVHASVPSGQTLRFRVDVGCDTEEKQAGYEIVPRYNEKPYGIFQRVADLSGRPAVDHGRVICGADEMFAPLEPGRDCTVVLRTLSSARTATPSRLGPRPVREFKFASPLKIEVHVDDRPIGVQELTVSERGFSDVVLTIPGAALTRPVSRIAFAGEHIACCYWFYQ